MERKTRVLVGKVGLDGHDRGAKVIASALRDGGFEVIYSGLHQTPEMIVEAALQEDVDVIGISLLSGAHMTLFPRIMELMKKNQMDDVLLIGGGTIPPEEAKHLEATGVGKIFGPGTDTRDIIEYIRQWAATRVYE
jgi:methylmalonyl-CoA mutase, C-terminal domain